MNLPSAILLLAFVFVICNQLINAFAIQPSKRDIIWMHMLEAPRIPNPTFKWQSKSIDGEVETILEVRNFDNYRKPYADTKNGFILLTRKGVPDMFSQLSTMDLMRLEKRRISMTPLNNTLN